MTSAPFAVHRATELGIVVTPELFRAAFPEREASTFILEGRGSGGARTRDRLDRAAYMGAEPIATFRARRVATRDHLGRALANVVIEHADGPRETFTADDAFGVLRQLLSTNALASETFDPRYPFPFRAGLVGYIGYECGQLLERLPCRTRPSLGMPDIAFALHRWVIATSRETGKSWLSVVGIGPSPTAADDDADTVRARIMDRLRSRTSPRPRAREPRGVELCIEPGIGAADYMARVAVAKEHIGAGDTFEICLTNVHRTPFAREDAWPLFLELLRSNPAPFAAWLDLAEGAVVSSSPERFLSLDSGRRAESRPIKGTRRRGASPEEDERLARELATSEKDRAENAMIVDLVRNDLGRVCRFGTVDAPELFTVEPYATVHQLVSTVRGELDPEKDAIDLLCACFPPGSMTGAPKIEAMSILEHLEPAERGVYSGALGWLDLGGAMDLSVVIRAVVVTDDMATFSVGGAIVADSDPHEELDETAQKALGLVRALEAVEAVSRRSSAAPGIEPASERELHP